jgi:hypothetical protein
MHSSNHKSHPSIASSLTKAGNTSAAIRRGKLEISDPIPIPQEDMSQLDPCVNDGRQGYPSSTSFAKTDTWPRRSTPTALQDSSQQDSHDGARILQASNTDNNFNRTSAALTNTHQSMSSLPSGGMVGKRGGVRATFRRMFGSKRRRDSFATGVNDQRSVGDTDLRSRIPMQPICNETKLTSVALRLSSRQFRLYSPAVAKAIPPFRGAHARQSSQFARAQCNITRTNKSSHRHW